MWQKTLNTNTMKKKSAEIKAAELNEKLNYKTKCNEWKQLQVNDDIMVMAALFSKSRTAISNAVNKGVGSIGLLRKVNDYFEKRKQTVS